MSARAVVWFRRRGRPALATLSARGWFGVAVIATAVALIVNALRSL